MSRYFMQLSYLGAPFHGWQSQPGEVTVQSTLENALSTLLRTPTAVVGAGRTDAGVNARRMIAHFDSDSVTVIAAMPRGLNSIMGPDVVVERIWPVADDKHARFSAVSRTYRYYVLTRRSPFFNKLAWTTRPLDFDAMNRAAARLLDVSDFTSFAKLHSDARTNICRVTRAEWVECGESAWYFEITADRFLRNMVRAVVGTLVDVGRGKLSLDGFDDIIARRDRCAAGTSMPAHALYLWDVRY